MSTAFTKTVGAAGFALLAVSASALASDITPAPERTFSWSVNTAITSDYVFRGVSQTNEDPAIQGGIDASYGILYAGLWASSVDDAFVGGAATEIDIYAGIKPVLGPATFDFGILYYWYPGSSDDAFGGDAEADYIELKAGVSGTILPNLVAGATLYWSPESTYEGGEYFVYEGALAYTLPTVWKFTPTLGGAIGEVDNLDFDLDYTYWNAGLALAVDKFTFDFRYWDTDGEAGFEGFYAENLRDERFVFTAKVVLP